MDVRHLNALMVAAVVVAVGVLARAQTADDTEQNETATHTIDVTVTGIRSDSGHVLLGLFNSRKGFPSDSTRAFSRQSVTITDGVARARFTDVPPGMWAVGVLHDENDNLKIDRIAGGIPKEGFGASNDAKAVFGPPKFKAASFELTGDKTITIKMKYF